MPSVSWGCCNKLSQTWWLITNRNLFSYSFWRPEVPNQGVGTPSRGTRALSIPCLTYLWGYCQHSLAFLGVHITSISAPTHKSPSLYVISLSFSLIRALVIGFKIHLNNSGWSYLKILNSPHLQGLFLTEVKFTRSRDYEWTYLWGATIQHNILEEKNWTACVDFAPRLYRTPLFILLVTDVYILTTDDHVSL